MGCPDVQINQPSSGDMLMRGARVIGFHGGGSLKPWVLFGIVFSLVMASNLAAAMPKFSEWSTPINLGPTINSAANDVGPAISRDGLSLYLGSNRAGGYGMADIWVSQRASADDPWGPAVNLGATINTAANENVPVLSRDGHWLFFASTRSGGFGGTDLWASWREHVHDDFGWLAPVNLGEGINSAYFDAGPSYFENEDLGAPLLFFNSDRPGGPGGNDVYVSTQQPDGSFGVAQLVEELSSDANDQRPVIRFDGLELFLWSDRPGSLGGTDLWVSTRERVSDPWGTPLNLGGTVNSIYDEAQPYIASDRSTLLFSSNRPGGVGGFDLYATTRS